MQLSTLITPQPCSVLSTLPLMAPKTSTPLTSETSRVPAISARFLTHEHLSNEVRLMIYDSPIPRAYFFFFFPPFRPNRIEYACYNVPNSFWAFQLPLTTRVPYPSDTINAYTA